MQKRFWIYLYFLVLFVNLVSIYTGNNLMHYFSKPLLIPSLIFYFYNSLINVNSLLKKWILLALFFSWLGDMLLMFESTNSNFFIFGLIVFLVAHIFYILFYDFVLQLEKIKKNYWLFIPVLVYYVFLVSLLSPNLGEMKLPVRIYGIVISYMLIQALQTSRIGNKRAALLFILGSLFFMVSDSLLAINKFYNAISHSGLFIIATYGIAQFLITAGAVKYISSEAKQ